MSTIDTLINFFSSPFLDFLLKGALIYLGILWFAIVVWVTRDIVNRTNSIFFQMIVILLNIALPVFGLLLYLILRPSKTLLEKNLEEMEYDFISEHSEESEQSCPRCEQRLETDYLFCPNCSEKIKKACSACKKTYLQNYLVCPYCGRKEKQIALKSKMSQKKLQSEKKETMSKK